MKQAKVYKSVNYVSFVYTELNDRDKGWRPVGEKVGGGDLCKIISFCTF